MTYWSYLKLYYAKQNKNKKNKTKNKKTKKKQKHSVSKLPCAFVLQCAFDSAKFKLLFFFLSFFYQLSWTCLSKYTWQDMIDKIKHFGQLFTDFLNSLIYFNLYLVHPKIKTSNIFHTGKGLCLTQTWHLGGGGREGGNAFKVWSSNLSQEILETGFCFLFSLTL